MDRFAVADGYNVAMLEWGHYARLDRLQRGHGYRAAPGTDTHEDLIARVEFGDSREAHRAYHVASRLYAATVAAGRFDPYDSRGPRAQLA